MAPTQRTALVLITRWSMICTASAPPAHSALTTAWRSCWWTTRSSGLASSGRTRSPDRGASSSVTRRPGPRTALVPATSSRARERRCSAATRRSVVPARSVAARISCRSRSTRSEVSSARLCSARIRSARSLRDPPRRSAPCETPALVANRMPAVAKATGAATRHTTDTLTSRPGRGRPAATLTSSRPAPVR